MSYTPLTAHRGVCWALLKSVPLSWELGSAQQTRNQPLFSSYLLARGCSAAPYAPGLPACPPPPPLSRKLSEQPQGSIFSVHLSTLIGRTGVSQREDRLAFPLRAGLDNEVENDIITNERDLQNSLIESQCRDWSLEVVQIRGAAGLLTPS